MSIIKALVIGNTSFTKQCLDLLPRSAFEICGLIQTKQKTVSDLDYQDLRIPCALKGIPYRKFPSLETSEARSFLASTYFDVILFLGFSNLPPWDLIVKFPNRCIFSYEGIFPETYGTSPLSWTILSNLTQIGLTFFVPPSIGLPGQILLQKTLPVNVSDDATSLFRKTSNSAKELLPLLREEIVLNYPSQKEVNLMDITNYWSVISSEDCQLRWDKSCQDLIRLIRAVTRPFSGAWFEMLGQKVRAWRAHAGKYRSSRDPGTLIYRDLEHFVVSTIDTDLVITDFDIIN